MLRLFPTLFLAVAAILAAPSAPSRAVPITFRIEGIGTGSLANVQFVDAPFIIQARADTDDVVLSGSRSEVVSTLASVTVPGLGRGFFSNETRTTSNPNVDRGGIGDFGLILAIIFVDNPIFDTYALDSALAPVAGPTRINDGTPFPTSIGDFSLSMVLGDAFFSATLPEPGLGAAALGTACALLTRRRWGAQAGA